MGVFPRARRQGWRRARFYTRESVTFQCFMIAPESGFAQLVGLFYGTVQPLPHGGPH